MGNSMLVQRHREGWARQLWGEHRDPPAAERAPPGEKNTQAGTDQERCEGQKGGTKARKEKVGGTPAGGHVPAVLETSIQLCQHVLALSVGEGVAEGKVGGGPAVLQEPVHEGQHKLCLHHLPGTRGGLGMGWGAQP